MKNLYILLIALLAMNSAYAQGCLPEGITFTTQAQIDNFQTNYPGCTEIEGDVGIWGDISNLNGLSALTHIAGRLDIEVFPGDPLTSLNGLNNLTSIGGTLHFFIYVGLTSFSGLEGLNSIGGDFTVTVNDVLTSFSGLDNLTSIGGKLRIGPEILGGTGTSIEPNTCLTSLTGLNSLTSIGGDLIIFGNGALTSIAELGNLTHIGGDLEIGFDGYSGLICGNSALNSLAGLENIDASSISDITIVNNIALSLCAVQSICDYLASPNGVVDIYGNATGCNNPPEVANGCGFTLQCLPFGNYYFFSQDEIDNFPSDYSGCTHLEGDVEISGSDITNLFGLNAINTIGGDLRIYDNDSLTSLAGLDSLTFIGSILEIGHIISWWNPPFWIGNPVLTDITGIENIDTNLIIGIYIVGNDSLSNCSVQSICDYLVSSNGYVFISSNSPGCNTQAEVEAACQVGLEEITINGFAIYPNPTTGLVTISQPENSPHSHLTILNLSGQELLRQTITELITTISISALPAGVYFVKVMGERTIHVQKILKQ